MSANPIDNDPSRVEPSARPSPVTQFDPAAKPFAPSYDPMAVPQNDYTPRHEECEVYDQSGCYKQGGAK